MTIQFSLREHKSAVAYNPDITWSKPSGSILRMNSTAASIGNGYVFVTCNRAWLHGKYIRFYWRGDYTWSAWNTLALIYDGEYDRSSDIDFPTGSGLLIKGAGLLQTLRSKMGDFAWETVDVQANVSGGTQEKCTIFFMFGDAWNSQSGWMEVDWIQINSAAGGAGPLYSESFDAAITMEQSGSTGDYGYISSGGLPEPASINLGAGFDIRYDYLTVTKQQADFDGKNNAPAYLYRLKNFPGIFTIEGEIAIYTGTENDGGVYFCSLATELNPIQVIYEEDSKVAGIAIIRQDPNHIIALGVQEGPGDIDGEEMNINKDVTYYFRLSRDALNHIRLDVYSDPDFSVLVGSLNADDKPHPTAYTHWYAIDSGGYIGKAEPYSAGKAMIARLRSI